MPKPDLGANVRVFSPDDDMKEVAKAVEGVFKRQHKRQFGPERQAFLFLPGDYVKAGTLNVGYYTQILGLGRTPGEVKLCNVKTPAASAIDASAANDVTAVFMFICLLNGCVCPSGLTSRPWTA